MRVNEQIAISALQSCLYPAIPYLSGLSVHYKTPFMSFSIFPAFFESNDYFIDEKVNLLKFENAYRVYNKENVQTGNIVQRLTASQKFLRLLLNKAMLPFILEVRDMQDQKLVSIKRGWTFWMSKIVILDATDSVIGTIKQKFKLFRPTFRITDSSENEMAVITGDWKAWNFQIQDASGNQIGSINKKWAGILKEAFTTADKYYVSIVPEYAEDVKKIAIVACAITIDMVLKESK